jgi:hypothetical protein
MGHIRHGTSQLETIPEARGCDQLRQSGSLFSLTGDNERGAREFRGEASGGADEDI